ncbi:hypothetical protein RJ639_010753 [Escallonia herrerae]|uniref:Transposase (putative) gypsy type domain-containing protein n=1 Tax=Escallonia herrerae TaxID=1293975 RepID=A0AA88VKM9_9ASTE|nr:hypothetical protein RJ639_010753 [Escallonia herrerae]
MALLRFGRRWDLRSEGFGQAEIGYVNDQDEDKVNPKPLYTVDEKSSKMSTEDLLELIREYPLPEGWYACLPDLQEPANYGTKFETVIYEEHVKSWYRLPLHPFALHFFKHYHMAPGQLIPNGWRKLAGLIYLVQTSGYKPDATDFIRVEDQSRIKVGTPDISLWAVWTEGNFHLIETGILTKAKWKRKEKQPSVKLPAALKKTRVTPPDRSPLIMYATGSVMLSCFEMARQVAAKEAQQKREATKEAEEATRCAEELSKQEADYLAQIASLEKKLERAKRKIYEMGFTKAKEMFAERFPDIPLNDFVMPAVVSPSGKTVMPSEAGDAASSHPHEEGPSGHAPKP